MHCYAVDGTSDDLDVPIKAVFSEPEYVAEHSLCSINSINWARILVQVSCDWWTVTSSGLGLVDSLSRDPILQISHFVYCYLQLADTVGDAVRVVCPTGACGNIACRWHVSRVAIMSPLHSGIRGPADGRPSAAGGRCHTQ